MIRILGSLGVTEGILRLPERTLTGTGDIAAADTMVYLDTTGGAFTATLPAAGNSRGQLVWALWKAGASAPTVSGTGVSHTFGTLGDSVTLHASATGWSIV